MSYRDNKIDCLLINTMTGKVFFKGFLNHEIIFRWLSKKNAAVKIWNHKIEKYVEYWGGALNE